MWWGNCLLYAWRQWRREGGYLVIRRSRYGWWWHFLWLPHENAKLHHFAPPPGSPILRRRWLLTPLFKGGIKIGDR